MNDRDPIAADLELLFRKLGQGFPRVIFVLADHEDEMRGLGGPQRGRVHAEDQRGKQQETFDHGDGG